MIPRIVFCSLILCATGDAFADDSFYVFAPDQKNQQLLHLSVSTNVDGVSIRQDEPLSLSFGPSSIAVHPDGNHLIVTASGNEKPPVATIEILKDSQLRVIESSALSHPSGYTSVDRSGRYFMTSHYGSGAIAVYHINANGSVGDQASSLKTPNTEAHCVLTTFDNRFVYIPCVKNNNAIYQFAFDQVTGRLSPMQPFNASPPAMFGPRHVAYHPTLPIAYFSNEQQLGVSVYQIGSNGQLTDKQHATTMPRRSPFVQGKRDLHASDLAVSPDGKRLFVAIRDFVGDEDSVFTFRVEDDGRLSQIARTKVGDIPWKLDQSPDGKLLLVSESADRRLSIYRIEPGGQLSPAAQLDLNTAARDMVVVGSER